MQARIQRLSRAIAASLKGYRNPDDTSTIESVVAALKERPRGTALILAGDLNTTLADPENDMRGTEIAAVPTEAGIEDMAAHFLPRRSRWNQGRRTWSMVREGKVVRYRTEYILGTDRSLFVKPPPPLPLSLPYFSCIP